jgi:hypothetical protein
VSRPHAKRPGDRISELAAILARMEHQRQTIRPVKRQYSSYKDQVVATVIEVLCRTLEARTTTGQQRDAANPFFGFDIRKLLLPGLGKLV